MNAVDPLVDLLRRCHRDELMALARVTRVNPQGLPLDRLARVVAITVRRHGGHGLANLFLRRGSGPPYAQVLLKLAARRGVDPSGSVEELELRLTGDALARELDRVDAERRRALWEELGLAGEPPERGDDAVAAASERLGARFGYLASNLLPEATPVGAVLALSQAFNPLARLFALLWIARPRDELLLPSVLEICRLRHVVRHRVTVGIVGSPSSGKDAAIGALFGIDTGNVNPVAGSTKVVSIHQIEGATALYVVNTPGMGDVIQAVTDEAKQVLDHIDVFVYVVNAQGGVQVRERDDHAACLRRGRPVLVVVNKVDTLREADRVKLVEDCQRKLGVDASNVVAAAFDPLPQLADSPIGVDAVQQWIATHLVALGKDPAELPWD